MPEKNYLTEVVLTTGLISLLTAGAFGAFGAIVQFLYLVVKEHEKYSVSRMLTFAIMGFFVGIVVSETMEAIWGQSYAGVVLVSGFLFMRFLDFLEESGFKIIADRLFPARKK